MDAWTRPAFTSPLAGTFPAALRLFHTLDSNQRQDRTVRVNPSLHLLRFGIWLAGYCYFTNLKRCFLFSPHPYTPTSSFPFYFQTQVILTFRTYSRPDLPLLPQPRKKGEQRHPHDQHTQGNKGRQGVSLREIFEYHRVRQVRLHRLQRVALS